MLDPLVQSTVDQRLVQWKALDLPEASAEAPVEAEESIEAEEPVEAEETMDAVEAEASE